MYYWYSQLFVSTTGLSKEVSKMTEDQTYALHGRAATRPVTPMTRIGLVGSIASCPSSTRGYIAFVGYYSLCASWRLSCQPFLQPSSTCQRLQTYGCFQKTNNSNKTSNGKNTSSGLPSIDWVGVEHMSFGDCHQLIPESTVRHASYGDLILDSGNATSICLTGAFAFLCPMQATLPAGHSLFLTRPLTHHRKTRKYT